MAFFEWNHKLSVGVAAVDCNHKMLIDALNQLHDAVQAGREQEVLDRLLSSLIAATEDHFSREETIWEGARYSGLAQHKREHAALLKTAHEFQAKYRAQRIAMSVDVLRALHGWVTKHIAVSDRNAADAIGDIARAQSSTAPDSTLTRAANANVN